MKYIVGPLTAGIISISILGRVTDWWVGPDAVIYVAGSTSGGIAKEIFDELKSKATDLKIDGKKILIKDVDDKGDPRGAREVSLRLAEASDTLMVIGHGSSTQTKEALPSYMKADPPIPVILTTETNPALLPPELPHGSNDYYPLFRLSPTDDIQARDAAEFAINQNSSVFWVVEDTSNPVYSKYLALEFIRTVQEKGKAVLLWSTNLTTPSVETFKALNINCVFFAGGWMNGLILIRQIKALSLASGIKMPRIILSDASVDQHLVSQGAGDVHGVYLTHPLGANEFKKEGYKLYGADAYVIIESLIKTANEEFPSRAKKRGLLSYWLKYWLNIHRIKDARFVISSVMQDAVRHRQTFEGTTGAKYGFINDGTRDKARFHIWQINKDQFGDFG